MAVLPSVSTYIQTTAAQFRAAVSEAMIQAIGGSVNYLLDHITIAESNITTIFNQLTDEHASSGGTFAAIFNNTGSYVTVSGTNISLSNNGTKVLVQLLSDGSNPANFFLTSGTAGDFFAKLAIQKSTNGGSSYTTTYEMVFGFIFGTGGGTIRIPASSINWIDTSSSTSVMYRLAGQVNNAACTCHVENCILFASSIP